ncbi:TetR/AcrR family transcriptional regulator [Jidongwangia harbinensis]|uniref:TetR/AcrR family transcriptional regulator n=1 Tax=Jidongwangia harbinensis TaxID=2878561 RepID=UPI001CD9BC00|nr:TetR/AcrR family transcriptional regulator [Jidongwangia harbinensis]MCA2216438.1 WHG domain-containing protein [Jidongwangia harbinensis]
MPRAGLAPATVVAAGAALADEVGLAHLTMNLLARRIGVRPPSLYKHVESLQSLYRGIALQGKRELREALTRATAGQTGGTAVHAFAAAYRRWVLEHPGRYAATVRAPAAHDEEDRRSSEEGLRVLLDVLADFPLHDGHAIHATRTLRSALHGFASLESAGGFGLAEDVDRSFRFLVDTLVTVLQTDRPDRGGPA